jgi:sugar/nucleoside kinase (ribokinase family)
MVSRLQGEKSEGGCEASFLAGETSGLTNPIPEPFLALPFCARFHKIWDLEYRLPESLPEKKSRRFALLGTITHDVITQASGRVLSGEGGVLYQAAGLCGLGQNVTLFTHVGKDIFFRVKPVIDRWPTCDSSRIRVVSGPGNSVFLHYPEKGERVEVLESHMPPLRPDRLLKELPAISFLILVINSGFDISLRDWRRIVRRAECPIWFDIHSLALTLELHKARRYRPLPEWKDWAKGTTYLQANLKEVASMLGEPERTPSPDHLNRFGEQAFELGIQAVFITLGAEGVLALLPGRTKKVGSAKASPVVDTTGCGDIFCAGAAALLAAGAGPVEAAAFGAELASEAAGVTGVEQTFSLVRNRAYYA